MKQQVRAGWSEVVLVCAKCSKKLKGGFGADGKEKLAKALRKRAGGKGRKAAFGVVEVGCLKICPKRAVTVVRGSAPRDWQIIEARTPVPTVMARLALAANASAGGETGQPLGVSPGRLPDQRDHVGDALRPVGAELIAEVERG